jgi:hypothetical protein
VLLAKSTPLVSPTFLQLHGKPNRVWQVVKTIRAHELQRTEVEPIWSTLPMQSRGVHLEALRAETSQRVKSGNDDRQLRCPV